ncbi:MAG: hypothetical protein AAF184_02435 [Pseudomonadota bacterium]
MMRKALLLALALTALVGCATVVRGTTDTLTVTTFPEGARVVSDIPVSTDDASASASGGVYGCNPTPCSIEVPRRSVGRLTVSLEGYQTISYRVVSSATTSNDVVPPGTLIAGLPPGSYVVVGTPQGGQVGLRGASGLTGLATYGAGSVIDAVSGANLNVAPRSVTVFLAPTTAATGGESTDDTMPAVP